MKPAWVLETLASHRGVLQGHVSPGRSRGPGAVALSCCVADEHVGSSRHVCYVSVLAVMGLVPTAASTTHPDPDLKPNTQ